MTTTRDKSEFINKNTESGCWQWLGQIGWGGYGRVRSNGKSTGAHRWSYAYHVGPIPEGLDILHTCDNPSCVNPDHLVPGTHGENMKQMYARNRRTHKGKHNPNYKHGGYVKDIIS